MTDEQGVRDHAFHYDYERNGQAIYDASFATIRAESDLGRFPDDISRVQSEDVEPALAELDLRFSGPLVFGTAGLRAAVGAGESRMNRAVVIRASAGLAARSRRPADRSR